MEKKKWLIPYLWDLRKLIMIMKLCSLFLLLSAVSVMANTGYSQNTKLTLNLQRVTVKEIFEEIEKNTEFIFVFYDDIIDLERKVSVKATDATVDKILEQIFASTNNTFSISDRQIVITHKESVNEEMIMVEKNPGVLEAPQPERKKLTGSVKDNGSLPLPGVTVVVKGTTVGTITDMDGNFNLLVPMDAKTLVLSFIGMKPQEFPIGTHLTFNVTMEEETVGLEEVVAIGYGIQKKASVVGSLVQTTSEELHKTGGATNLAMALTGNLAGVTTVQQTSEPGGDDPRILIRGVSSPNASPPLILVDGIERRMNDLDVNEVESVSVLKDASATAVFGVKGANGVILITTKRGKIGKPVITVDANISTKQISREPEKLNSYDQFTFRNRVIEYELNHSGDYWGQYMPGKLLQNYKQPQDPKLKYIFPDVDWEKEMVKPFPVSKRVSVTVSGGTEFAKYFSSISYNYDDDIINTGIDPMNAGYKSSMAYERLNFRTNLDLSITRSTTFSLDLAGWTGNKSAGWGNENANVAIFRAFAETSPDEYPILQEDGSYGWNPNEPKGINPLQAANSDGISYNRRVNVSTDYILKQDLDFITKGLSARGSLSFDNTFYSVGGIEDGGQVRRLYIEPGILDAPEGSDLSNYYQGYLNNQNANDDYDWVKGSPIQNAEISTKATDSERRLFYQVQFNYARTFNRHDVSVLALVNREQYAKGSQFPRYREDWVGRVTYGYDNRYLFDTNFAYNGSEQFGPGYRFGFFPSIAAGWVLSNEKFLKYEWLSNLKIRYSIGKVGSDNIGASRWSYQTQWRLDTDNTYFGYPQEAKSPNNQYIEAVIGNPVLQWESVVKQNLGLDVAVFKNKLAMVLEVFKDVRSDIYRSGDGRVVAPYYGASPVAANVGKVEVKGYEFEISYRNKIGKDFNYNLSFNHTGAFDKVLYMEDAPLMESYLKAEGYSLNQIRTQQQAGFLNNWDEVYSSSSYSNNNQSKLPGDYRILDFNADGGLNTFDAAPYSYPIDRPQHTYSLTLGGDYKGFSARVQFYGMYNISREYTGWLRVPFYNSLTTGEVLVNQTDMWTPEDPNGKYRFQRLDYQGNGGYGTTAYEDGSLLRLKTAEIAYTMDKGFFNQIGASSLRFYLNGNNLILWSKVVEDREARGDDLNNSVYPMTKNYNLGVTIKF